MSWPKIDAIHYHVQLSLSYKGRAIKGMVVAIVGMLLPEDLPNGLALRCYQPSRPLRYEASPDFESNYIYIVIHIWIEFIFVFQGNSGES